MMLLLVEGLSIFCANLKYRQFTCHLSGSSNIGFHLRVEKGCIKL